MKGLPFTLEEYEERLGRIRASTAQGGLDALIVTGPENMYYVSGFRAVMTSAISPLMAIVIPVQGEPKLITRSLEAKAANQQWMSKPVLFMDHADPFKLLAEILTENGAASGIIGVEESNLTVGRLKRMKQAMPKARFKDGSQIIKDITAYPSKAEIGYVKKAASIANIGFQRGIETIKEGVFCYDVVGEIHNAMFKAGQTDTLVGRVWCWAGPQGGQIHSSSLDYRIQTGDLVTIELGGVHNMYRVNAQGTVYVGKNPPEILRETYRMVAEMYKGARETVKPGAKAGDVYDGANRIYRQRVGEDYFRRIGGSISLSSFAINLAKENRDILNPGVALLVQSLVDEPCLITCSSTLLVTETGWDELTQPLLALKTV